MACIGRRVQAGHVPGQVRRVGCGRPGGGDELRAYRDPRTTGTAGVAVWNRDLAAPVTGMPNAASG
jgi:hypothetical protein